MARLPCIAPGSQQSVSVQGFREEERDRQKLVSEPSPPFSFFKHCEKRKELEIDLLIL